MTSTLLCNAAGNELVHLDGYVIAAWNIENLKSTFHRLMKTRESCGKKGLNMSKAILVIDMPKRCTECSAHFLDTPDNHTVKLWCGYKCKEVVLDNNKIGDKPTWCPLKPLPEKEDVDLFSDHAGYALGYNACIDKILGGENDKM